MILRNTATTLSVHQKASPLKTFCVAKPHRTAPRHTSTPHHTHYEGGTLVTSTIGHKHENMCFATRQNKDKNEKGRGNERATNAKCQTGGAKLDTSPPRSPPPPIPAIQPPSVYNRAAWQHRNKTNSHRNLLYGKTPFPLNLSISARVLATKLILPAPRKSR